MSRCEVLGRVSPGRVGRISLAVVALGREMVTRLPFWVAQLARVVQRSASRHLHGDLPGVALGYCPLAVHGVRGGRGYGAARA